MTHRHPRVGIQLVLVTSRRTSLLLACAGDGEKPATTPARPSQRAVLPSSPTAPSTATPRLDPTIAADLGSQAIFSTPERFVGRQVTVRGLTEQAFGRMALTVSDGDPAHAILVVGPPEIASGYHSPFLMIRGTVRLTDRAMLEREVGIDLGAAEIAPFLDRPVIVAEEVTGFGYVRSVPAVPLPPQAHAAWRFIHG